MARSFFVHSSNPERRAISQAVHSLTQGHIVILPTETGYCFAGSAIESSVHSQLLKLREAHPKQKPFSLLCKDIAQAALMSTLPTPIFRLARKAFPGPYTFILEISRNTPQHGTKRKAVGIRISSHPIAQAVLMEFGDPLLVTSVTDAEELLRDNYFEEQNQEDHWWTSMPAILDRFGPQVDVALESDELVPMAVSTVIDFTQDPPVLIRDGGWGDDVVGQLG